MSQLRPERYFSLDATRTDGVHGYMAEAPDELDIYDLAWLVGLMDTLKQQFEEDLIGILGPDRAYLLVEYQKQTLAEFTTAIAQRVAAEPSQVATPAPANDPFLQAQRFIKQENPDLFSEGPECQ